MSGFKRQSEGESGADSTVQKGYVSDEPLGFPANDSIGMSFLHSTFKPLLNMKD